MPRAKKSDDTADVKVEEATPPPEPAQKGQVELPHSMSVRQLADLLQVSAIDIIKQLMRKDIMANINQVIDYDIASEIATNLGYESRVKSRTAEGTASAISEIRKRRKLQVEEAGNLQHALLWLRLWAMLTTARHDCSMLSARPMSWILKPVPLRSTSVPIR